MVECTKAITDVENVSHSHQTVVRRDDDMAANNDTLASAVDESRDIIDMAQKKMERLRKRLMSSKNCLIFAQQESKIEN